MIPAFIAAAALAIAAVGLYFLLRGRVGELASAPYFYRFLTGFYVLLFAFFAILTPPFTLGAWAAPVMVIGLVVAVELGLFIGLQQLGQRNDLVRRVDRMSAPEDVRRLGFGWLLDFTRSRRWRRWF